MPHGCTALRCSATLARLYFPISFESNEMSASFKDDAYRQPHYGRDGLMPDWSGGWKPPRFPDWPPPPVPVTPVLPETPGLPWWLDPWMPTPPKPPAPEQQPQVLSDDGGLLALLRDVTR